MSKSRPVVIAMSVLAGLQVLGAGAALTEVIGGKAAALFVLVVAAAQVGVQFYVQSQVVPVVDVAAYRDGAGDIVSGPAAPPEGREAEVVAEGTTGPVAEPYVPEHGRGVVT